MILIVDHDTGDRRRATAALEAAGHSIRTAPDADTAMRLLEVWTPQLIVLDLDLPDIDGLALAAMLRWKERLRTVPIVAVAAPESPHAHELQIGAFEAVMSKPIEATAFARHVDVILERTSRFLARREAG